MVRFASFVIAATVLFVTQAHARTVNIPSHKGKVYADFLKRTCKPNEWKAISPFLDHSNFAETQFPSFEFEMENEKITSPGEKFQIDMQTGKPRMTVDGEALEGSLCEIAVQISNRATVAAGKERSADKFDVFALFVEPAHARTVLKTEVTKGDYARRIAIGVGAGAGAVLTSAVPILAGAFVAAGAGAIAGDIVATDMTVEFNRRQLESIYTNIRKGLLPVACTDTTVVFRASGGREVILTRGRDPDIYIKTPQHEGRLRASFSGTARSVADRYKTCRTSADVVKFNERFQATRRQDLQRRRGSPDPSAVERLAPPSSIARVETPAPRDTGEEQLAELDGLFEVTDEPATAPAAQRSSSN